MNDICGCGKAVDGGSLHGLSCRRSSSRHQRHSVLNDIVWTAIKRAKIPTLIELILLNGKCPDEATLIPQFQTRMQSLVCNPRHLKPAVQRTKHRRRNASSRPTRNLTPHTYPSQLPSKLLAHGINKRWSWYKQLANESHSSQYIFVSGISEFYKYRLFVDFFPRVVRNKHYINKHVVSL